MMYLYKALSGPNCVYDRKHNRMFIRVFKVNSKTMLLQATPLYHIIKYTYSKMDYNVSSGLRTHNTR